MNYDFFSTFNLVNFGTLTKKNEKMTLTFDLRSSIGFVWLSRNMLMHRAKCSG